MSACTAEGDSISGSMSEAGNDMNIIYNNDYIKGIVLPDTLTSIGDYAFINYSNLISVTFAAGSNIADDNFGNYAFPEGGSGDVDSLKEAYLDEELASARTVRRCRVARGSSPGAREEKP